MFRTLAAFSLTLALTSPALAANDYGAAADETESTHAIAVTISPIHLALPVFEVQVEAKIAPLMSVSGIVGYGSVSVSDGLTDDTFDAFELGAQFAYYALGDFDHGLQLGVEALYVGVSADADSEFSGVFGRGLALSPFVGYKVAADFGLTFMAQLGPMFSLISAESGETSDDESVVGVLLNLNLGWSF